MARGLVGRHANVKLVVHEERRGYGACLRSGLAIAQFALVAYAACDYPYQPGDIRKLLESIDSADLVSGCRTDPAPAYLQRISAVFRVAVRVLFGLPLEPRPGWGGWAAWCKSQRDRWIYGLRLWDVGSAFKLFRKSVLDRMVIQSDGEFIHAEILAKANFRGCLIAEVPISRPGGAFKGVAEPKLASESSDRRRVFRQPEFVSETARVAD
jgi:hypothetical protein